MSLFQTMRRACEEMDTVTRRYWNQWAEQNLPGWEEDDLGEYEEIIVYGDRIFREQFQQTFLLTKEEWETAIQQVEYTYGSPKNNWTALVTLSVETKNEMGYYAEYVLLREKGEWRRMVFCHNEVQYVPTWDVDLTEYDPEDQEGDVFSD